MEEGPDLSHLTPEERAIIESVMVRQKQEEEREQEIMRKKADEVHILEESIRARNEQHKKAGIELDATCHICLKTKFADGVGHICNYCSIRCCARCGGKVTLRSNKVVWVCILCRKKQELLSKTGQWMVTGPASEAEMMMMVQHQQQGGQQGGQLPPMNPGSGGGGGMMMQMQQAPSDKRPKLERAHSAAEKENLPLQRSGSMLRRQYSEQEPNMRTPSCERTSSYHHHQQQHQLYNEDDPRFYQGELEGLMRTHPHLVPRRYPDLGPAPLPMDIPPHHHHQQQQQPQGRGGGVGMGMMMPTLPHQQQQMQQQQQPQQQQMMTTMMMSANKKPKRSGSQKKLHQQQQSQQQNVNQPAPQLQQRSFSSSEEDLKSTEYGSDERDSEKGSHERDKMSDSLSRQAILDEKIKKFLAHPLSWQVSADGTQMIGHMILRRSLREGSYGSTAYVSGLRIVGGQLLENGQRGALIEEVQPGSVAEVEGKLRPGDEVIEWNGRSLKNKTYQEVADIIAESKQEAHVELIVSRRMTSRRAAQATWRQSMAHRGQHWHQQQQHLDMEAGHERPHVLVTSPGSPERPRPNPSSLAPSVGGRIQIRLGFDPSTLQLFVTLVCAAGLSPRSPAVAAAAGAGGQQHPHVRTPYCKLFLLPDRSEKSKRRTKTWPSPTEPMWNQTFVYSGLRRADLRLRALEITVWDNVRYGANDFLGEAIVELWPLDEQPMWRTLGPHEEVALTPSEHLSPPSTGSRFSDSDTPSECDADGGRERRGADGASVSSVGSSASPPRELVHSSSTERRSRRDYQDAMVHDSGYGSTTQGYRRSAMGVQQRSHSAAPCDSPSVHMSRSRSKSPRRAATDQHRSLSPSDVRIPSIDYHSGGGSTSAAAIPGSAAYGNMPPIGQRFQSRSETATPTGSPKKRQLPQVPQALARALQERVAQDLDQDSRRHYQQRVSSSNRYVHMYRSTGSPGGWEQMRRYSGLSDSDLATHTRSSMFSDRERFGSRRGMTMSSPDRDRDRDGRDPLSGLVDFDSDMESVASVTSSAFSTQSERPRGTRAIRQQCLPSTVGTTDPNNVSGAEIETSRIASNNRIHFSSLSKKISHKEKRFLKRSNTYSTRARESFPDRQHIKNKRPLRRSRTLLDYTYFTATGTSRSDFYKMNNSHFSTLFNARSNNEPYRFSPKSHNKSRHLLPSPLNILLMESDFKHSISLLPKTISVTSNTSANTESLNENFVCILSDAEKLQNCEDYFDYKIIDEDLNCDTINSKDKELQHCNYCCGNKTTHEDSLVAISAKLSNIDHFNCAKSNYGSIYIRDKKIRKCRDRDVDDNSQHSGYDSSDNDQDCSDAVQTTADLPDDRELPQKSSTTDNDLDGNDEIVGINKIFDFVRINPDKHKKPKSVSFALDEDKDSDLTSHLDPYDDKNYMSSESNFSKRSSIISKFASGSRRTRSPNSYTFIPEISTEYGTGSDRYGYTTASASTSHHHRGQQQSSGRSFRNNNNNNNPDLMSRGSGEDPLEPMDPHYHHSNRSHHTHHHHHRESSIKRAQFTRSLSNTETPNDEKTDGSLSDTAVTQIEMDVLQKQSSSRKESHRERDRERQTQFVGLSKKSNSTSQLSATGRKRRMGFGRRGKTSFTVHRSEEVLPGDVRLSKQGSSASSDGEGSADGDSAAGGGYSRKRVSTSSSIQRSQEVVPANIHQSGAGGSRSSADSRAPSLNSISSSEASSWSPSLKLAGDASQLAEFIEDLGPGQLVGRQILGAPALGKIQLSLVCQKGSLEVEIVKAKDLILPRPDKELPVTRVVVYLVNGKKLLKREKFGSSRPTLEPYYNKRISFKEDFRNCILQVRVDAEYEESSFFRKNKLVYIGIAQIMLDDLDLSNIIMGWYKLFYSASL